MKLKYFFILLLVFFFVIPVTALAASSSFLTNAQKWYNNECKNRPDRVRGQDSALCYVFDRVKEIDIENSNQNQKITELEERIEELEALHPSLTPTPIPSKRVFISSTSYDGSLGGLSGADSKCQARADAASLGGNWKAWLSDISTSASSRLNHHTGPYKLLNGNTLANNWNDLTDGSIQYPINLSEINTTINVPFVWTHSFSDGSIRQLHDDCVSWTSTSSGGSTGDSTRTDGGWSDYGATACTQAHPLYCFEQ